MCPPHKQLAGLLFHVLTFQNSAVTVSLPNTCEFHFPSCYPGIRTDLIIIVSGLIIIVSENKSSHRITEW